MKTTHPNNNTCVIKRVYLRVKAYFKRQNFTYYFLSKLANFGHYQYFSLSYIVEYLYTYALRYHSEEGLNFLKGTGGVGLWRKITILTPLLS